jgi:hypothetical protein
MVSCRDGSKNCPVAGTLGSYGFYILGIFMACVYILGPKTAFGQSEQNPAYWIQLLIAAKHTGACVTWFDPVENATKKRVLSPSDIRVVARFFMSFLINGVGFHILAHALPIQVATQSTLTGVVIRAVGMLYLVDLDDTSGYTLTIVEESDADQQQQQQQKNDQKDENGGGKTSEGVKTSPNVDDTVMISSAELSDEAQRIIAEAKAQLDALARGDYNMNKNAKLHGGGILTGAAIFSAGDLANKKAEGGGGAAGGDDGDQDGGGADGEVVVDA